MSTTQKVPDAPPQSRPRVTLPHLAEMKSLRQPIVMVTAYDYPSAQIVDEAGVDIVLVGDSAAMTVLGYDSTVPVSMDEMVMLTAAVRRGLAGPLLVADMPFGSYQSSNGLAVESAARFVKEAGADAVKLEGAGEMAERARAIVAAGIPVMGHAGLTPQTATSLGGYRAQGRNAERALEIANDALALERAGCFAVVLEAVPSAIVEQIAPLLNVATIGIGAGPSTDGQVLVYHDLLGIYDGHTPRFAKRYAHIRQEMVEAVAGYTSDVRGRSFPSPEHTYSIDPDELQDFRVRLQQLAR